MADDVGLPKSSLQKAIKDLLPREMRIAGDASDLLVQCCNQFVHLVSTQVGGRQGWPLELGCTKASFFTDPLLAPCERALMPAQCELLTAPIAPCPAAPPGERCERAREAIYHQPGRCGAGAGGAGVWGAVRGGRESG